MPVDGLQVNVCRNLQCRNYGVPPLGRVDRGSNPVTTDDYRAVGVGNGQHGLCCKACGESFTSKSNLAVAEELQRLREQSAPVDEVGCATKSCPNYRSCETVPPSRYQSYGRSAGGSRRWRCKACRKTFTIPTRATLRQRQPDKNELIFRLLINKSPMRRICEVADIHSAVLYQRIGFLYRQCILAAAAVETPLASRSFLHMGIAVDRQEHVVNWSSQFDRRVTQLSAVASADVGSGFVFGTHLDYDPRFDVHDLDLAARECGDAEKPEAFRRYARVFLPFETGQAAAEQLQAGTQLPSRGVRVHSQYTLFAHFLFLKERLLQADGLHFYLDRDAGIVRACFAAFGEKLRSGDAEAFLVKINKSMMIDDKKRALATSQSELVKAQRRYPGLRKMDLARCLIVDQLARSTPGRRAPAERWLTHPLPTMGEPMKEVCYCSDRGDLSPEILAEYVLDVRMLALDRFFMQVRRRLSVLERPIHTPSGQRRWHGYSVYNPTVVAHLLEIFRVAYNLSLAGTDGKTPAMRLGLTKAPMTLQDIIEFVPAGR